MMTFAYNNSVHASIKKTSHELLKRYIASFAKTSENRALKKETFLTMKWAKWLQSIREYLIKLWKWVAEQQAKYYNAIHSIFHVSLLKFWHLRDENSKSQIILVKEEEKWEMKKIIDQQIKKEKVKYLVQWVDLSFYENFWESIKNLSNAKKIIENYETEDWQRDSSVHDVDYEFFDFILCLNKSQKSQEISIRRSLNNVRMLHDQKSHYAEFSLTQQHLL